MTATPSSRLRLRREQRLRSGGDFVRLKNEGRRRVQGCLILNWQPSESFLIDHSRVGVITAKTIGGAVLRNRARRLLRESFRRHQEQLAQPVVIVLVARRSIAGKSYSEVETDFLKALDREHLLISGPSLSTDPAT